MKVKVAEFEVDPSDPFKNDMLFREDSAIILTQFISSIDEPCVIAIDSPWGTGKTTFLKMWKAYLRKEGIASLYFNAWESDFHDDPMIPIIATVSSGIDDFNLDDENKEVASKRIKKIKKIAINLSKNALVLGTKLATGGLFDLSDVAENAIAQFGESIISEQFKAYEEQKESLIEFKSKLSEFCSDVNKNGVPLVFIIDELDRCRPDYSIKMLERIKHLFGLKNIVFILGVDKDQLSHSVSSVYGSGIDNEGYLTRFIDFNYHLPKPEKIDLINYILDSHGINHHNNDQLLVDYNEIVEQVNYYSTIFNCSLRDIHQIISQFVIVLRLSSIHELLDLELLFFLLFIWKKNNNFYIQIKTSKYSISDIIEFLKNFPENNKINFSGMTLYAWLELNLMKIDRNYVRVFDLYNSTEFTSEFTNNVASLINQYEGDMNFRRRQNLVFCLINKIEMAEKFS